MATLGLLKTRYWYLQVLLNKAYNVIIPVHDFTNKTSLRDSNYIVDVVIWGEGCSWLKFNNLGVALGMALKFYRSLAKRLKPKVRKFLWLVVTFVEVIG